MQSFVECKVSLADGISYFQGGVNKQYNVVGRFGLERRIDQAVFLSIKGLL